MSVKNELNAICRDLLAKGKPLNVGMVKSKASSRIPLAEIINVVQTWKQQQDPSLFNDIETNAQEQTASPALTLEERVTALESQLQKVLERINELEAKS